MKTSDIIHDEIPWQATLWGWSQHPKDEELAAKIRDHRLPKELTKEATFMIYLMLSFVLLAVIGSSVTAYEFFFEENRKKINSRKNGYEAKRIKIIVNVKKYLKNWLEDCKYFLKLFCIVKNGRKILSTSSTENQITCIQGLRLVGSVWIILLHMNIAYIVFLKDAEEAKPIFEFRASQLLLNGFFAVDMFFFIRLTPVYMILLGFYTTLFTYIGTGILWPNYKTNPACKQDWWMHFLYINNFEESNKQCMAIYWHLAVEIQYFLISPLFLISLKRWPKFGRALVFVCIFGSCAASFMLTYQFNLTDGISRFGFHLADIHNFTLRYFEYFDKIHTKPYTRISQYLVGITLGHYLYEKRIRNKVIRNSKMTLYCGWIATASFMWIYFFSLYNRNEVLFETALYNGTKYFLSSFSSAWIIYTCFTGQAGYLNTFLSWKLFFPLSRLSYCVYIIHPIIIAKLVLGIEYSIDFNLKSLIMTNLYACACTYIISFLASMFYEMPVLNILEWLDKKNGVDISSMKNSDYKDVTQSISDIYKIS